MSQNYDKIPEKETKTLNCGIILDFHLLFTYVNIAAHLFIQHCLQLIQNDVRYIYDLLYEYQRP